MLLEVKNRWTGENKFTADIPNSGDDYRNLGLAALWASKNGQDLVDADLSNANMTGMDLSNTDFSGAILHNANLCHTNMTGCTFKNTDLTGADMFESSIYDLDVSYGVQAHGYTFYRLPLQIQCERTIHLWDGFMKVECVENTFRNWTAVNDEVLIEMGGLKLMHWLDVWWDLMIKIATDTGRLDLPE